MKSDIVPWDTSVSTSLFIFIITSKVKNDLKQFHTFIDSRETNVDSMTGKYSALGQCFSHYRIDLLFTMLSMVNKKKLIIVSTLFAVGRENN